MNQRTREKTIKLLGCMLLGLVATCKLAYADDSPSLQDDPRLLAKTAKAKAKGSQQSRMQNDAGGNQTSSCGGIDIGNITTPQPFGVPREVTVFIAGDVINADNKCKR